MFKRLILNFFKRQFNDNPIVTEPNAYLPKVKQAVTTGMKLSFGLIVLTILAIIIFMIGVLSGFI